MTFGLEFLKLISRFLLIPEYLKKSMLWFECTVYLQLKKKGLEHTTKCQGENQGCSGEVSVQGAHALSGELHGHPACIFEI